MAAVEILLARLAPGEKIHRYQRNNPQHKSRASAGPCGLGEKIRVLNRYPVLAIIYIASAIAWFALCLLLRFDSECFKAGTWFNFSARLSCYLGPSVQTVGGA